MSAFGFPYFGSYFGRYFPFVGCPIFPLRAALFSKGSARLEKADSEQDEEEEIGPYRAGWAL